MAKKTKYGWVKRALDKNSPTTKDNETVRTASTKYKGAEILFPTIRMIDGKLNKFDNITEAKQHALVKDDYLVFPSAVEATDFSKKFSKYIDKTRNR
tara:strand:+ start:88 stop:378 length:291 start_codon:yes stop_codon:yes gene_type:complete